MKITGRKKLRFYLAYLRRKESPNNPMKYHVGLLLAPKNPDNDSNAAMMYHATNLIDGDILAEKWIFEHKMSVPRTIRFGGVVLLGKVPQNFSMETITPILKKVYVPTLAEAKEKDWHCRHWVLGALELLATEGVIPLLLASSAQEVYEKGLAFVEEKTRATNGFSAHNEWLYTCDMFGKEIKSEIGPLNIGEI